MAFFGTGRCDPNKGLYELLAIVSVVVGWTIVIILIKKINHSCKSTIIRITASILLILAGVFGTFSMFLAVWLGLACSGG